MTLHDQVALTTFRKPRMAALCGRLTPNDVVFFTTLGGPLFAFKKTMADQVVFSTTFRKPRMAALRLQMTPYDKVAFTTFRVPRMAALCL